MEGLYVDIRSLLDETTQERYHERIGGEYMGKSGVINQDFKGEDNTAYHDVIRLFKIYRSVNWRMQIKVNQVKHLALTDALNDGYLKNDPLPGVKKRYWNSPKITILTKEQVKIFLAAAKEYHSIYLEVLLALFCGLRKGEIMGLKYKDFDFLQHTVSINRQITRDYDVVIEEDRTFKIATQRLSTKPPKSYSSYRTLIISAFIFDELEIRKKENEEILKLTENHEWAEYICLGVKGNIKSDGTYTEAIKRICKRNGLPHITMHGLRHMFATILIEQGVSLEKISKLMGHKSVATTFEIYCGIMEAKKEIAKTIDSVMDPAIGAVKVRSKGGIVCM